MAINNDPLGILSSLRGIPKGPVQPSPRQQALIDRLAAIGGGMTRKGNGWEVWGASDRGWANNLNGVEDTISDFERYFWDNNSDR